MDRFYFTIATIFLVFFISFESQAATNYLVCYYKDSYDNERWEWASFGKSYVQLNGDFSGNNFVETVLHNNHADKICEHVVEHLFEKNNIKYFYEGKKKAGSSIFWYDYDLHFKPYTSKFELSPDFIINALLPGQSESTLLGQFEALDEDQFREACRSFRSFLRSEIALWRRAITLTKMQLRHLKTDREKAVFMSTITYVPMFQINSFVEGRKSGNSFADTQWAASQEGGIEAWHNAKISALEKVYEVFSDTDKIIKNKIETFHSMRNIVLHTLAAQAEIGKNYDRVKLLLKNFDERKHVPIWVLDNHQSLIAALIEWYLTVMGNQSGMQELYKLKSTVHLKKKAYNRAKQKQRVFDAPVRTEANLGYSPAELLPVKAQSSDEGQHDPSPEPKTLNQQKSLVAKREKKRISPHALKSPQVVHNQRTKFVLDRNDLETIKNLNDTSYRKTVNVNDYINSYINIVKNNLDLFEFASVSPGQTIKFEFKRIGQKRVTYSVHKPHGRGSTREIPTEYRDEYNQLFVNMGVTHDHRN